MTRKFIKKEPELEFSCLVRLTNLKIDKKWFETEYRKNIHTAYEGFKKNKKSQSSLVR